MSQTQLIYLSCFQEMSNHGCYFCENGTQRDLLWLDKWFPTLVIRGPMLHPNSYSIFLRCSLGVIKLFLSAWYPERASRYLTILALTMTVKTARCFLHCYLLRNHSWILMLRMNIGVVIGFLQNNSASSAL